MAGLTYNTSISRVNGLVKKVAIKNLSHCIYMVILSYIAKMVLETKQIYFGHLPT